ncbi:2-hydroxy-palmitic acid dioxygenase MPO1 [Linum grandiflorum]
MGGKKTGLLDLESHYGLYRAYHLNPTNIMIHTLFIWPIFFINLMLFHFTPRIPGLPEIHCLGRPLVPNFGLVFMLFHALFFAALDVKAGTLAASLCIACWIGASHAAAHLGFSLIWKIALVAHTLGRMTQFTGHYVFEKRVRTALDSFVQAPHTEYFVLLEVLYQLFGYEPYPGFQAGVEAKSAVELKKWEEKNQMKKAKRC